MQSVLPGFNEEKGGITKVKDWETWSGWQDVHRPLIFTSLKTLTLSDDNIIDALLTLHRLLYANQK